MFIYACMYIYMHIYIYTIYVYIYIEREREIDIETEIEIEIEKTRCVYLFTYVLTQLLMYVSGPASEVPHACLC